MPRHVDHDARREEIIRATLAILAERGPRGVTFRNVAARMGGSSTLVTHYYGSRQELIDALAEMVVDWAEDLGELEYGVEDAGERLRLFMYWMVPTEPQDYIEERARIKLSGGDDESVKARGLFDAWNETAREHFRQHVTELVSAERVETVVDILRSITNGVTLSVIEQPEEWPAERQRRVIDDALAMLGLAGPVAQ